MLIISSHIHELLRAGPRPEPGRYDSGSDGNALHCLEDQPDAVAGFPLRRKPEFTPVAKHGPNGYGSERAGLEFGSIALERDSDQPALHFLDQLIREDGELEKQNGLDGEAIVLDAEPHVAAAVAEDGSDDHRFRRSRRRRRRRSLKAVVGIGGRRIGILILIVGSSVVLLLLGDVVPERGTEAFLGRWGGGRVMAGVCGGVGNGGVDAEEESTEGVDGHG